MLHARSILNIMIQHMGLSELWGKSLLFLTKISILAGNPITTAQILAVTPSAPKKGLRYLANAPTRLGTEVRVAICSVDVTPYSAARVGQRLVTVLEGECHLSVGSRDSALGFTFEASETRRAHGARKHSRA